MDSTGKIVEQCVSCKQYDECIESTPLNGIVERRVMFVRFTNGCEHERNKIGFHQTTKGT
jgi:hypothetical protein